MAYSSTSKALHFSQTPHSSKLQHYPSPRIKFKFKFTPRNFNFKIVSSATLNEPDQTPSASAQPTNNLRVVFAAGGTGGHIAPAISIADDLKNMNPNIQILFLGTNKGMESSAIPTYGYDFVPIQAFPLARPFYSPKNFVFPFYLIKSIFYSWKILRDFNPHLVLGTGGYVSAPVCFAARAVKGVKLVIQEQNSMPGIANRVLAFLASVVFVAFPSSVNYFPKGKCIVSGNPIRLSIRQYASKPVARFHFFPKAKNWNSQSKVVLVLGGSLGANAINMALLNMYYLMLVENKNLYIIWQTGIESFNEMESLVKHHSHLVLTPFLHTMDLAYVAADLVVSRAGAMTCSEIFATGKPSILIPSPNVAEGHQVKNALIMSDLAGSKVITEHELDSTTLKIAIQDVLGDEILMADMSRKALKAARPNASLEIAQHIVSLAEVSAAKGR